MVACHMVLAGALAVPFLARVATAADQLDILFEQLKKSPGMSAKFREDKHIELLSSPVRSEGNLHFVATIGLARHTLKPRFSSVLLTSAGAQTWDGKRVEAFPLATDAPLRALIDVFGLLLAGDRRGIEQRFTVTFVGKASGTWRIDLVPKDAAVAKLVKHVALGGEGAVPRELRVDEASGDYGITNFTDVDVNRRYSPEETIKFLRLPPPP